MTFKRLTFSMNKMDKLGRHRVYDEAPLNEFLNY